MVYAIMQRNALLVHHYMHCRRENAFNLIVAENILYTTQQHRGSTQPIATVKLVFI